MFDDWQSGVVTCNRLRESRRHVAEDHPAKVDARCRARQGPTVLLCATDELPLKENRIRCQCMHPANAYRYAI